MSIVYILLMIVGGIFFVDVVNIIMRDKGNAITEIELFLVGIGFILCLVGISIERVVSAVNKLEPKQEDVA